MPTLITGGTGFLGAHLARFLVTEQGCDDVVLFDRFPSPDRIHGIRDQVRLVEGDVLDGDALLATMRRHDVDRVAHFAFLPGTAHPERIVPYVQMTCVGSATVFDAARRHDVARVVNASSMAVYGPPGATELHEDDHPQPQILYGGCKLWTEHLADIYNRQHGMEILSLRVCATMGLGRLSRASLAAGLMGPEMRHFMAAPELVARGEGVVMPPDDQPTEFIYAGDTARAWWQALTVDRPAHSVFNLSAGRTAVGKITARMRHHFRHADIEVSDVPVQPGPLLNTDRLRSELRFEPRYTLADAVDAYVAEVRATLA